MNELRKILVRAPQTIGAQVGSFAAIHWLVKNIGSVAVDIVVDANKPHAYEYADFHNSIHALPAEKDGPLGIFPWVHGNNDIFGVDTYLDLANEKGSATLGIAIKAMRRLGYASMLTKATYTKSILAEEASEFSDERALRLMSLLLEKEFPGQIIGSLPNADERERQQVRALGDFIFIGIRASEWARHKNIWTSLFDELAGGSLVIAIDQDIDDLAAKEWLSARKSENFFVIEKNYARTDLMLMHASRGIITDSALYGNLAPYYGLQCFVLAFDLADYPSYSTFSPRQELILERGEKIDGMIDANGNRIDMDSNTIIDAIFRAFKL